MPPTPQPSEKDDAHQQLLDQMDTYYLAKPFKSSEWKPSQRRNKNIKQILSEAHRREASVMATQNNSGASTPMPPSEGTITPLPNITQAAQSLSTLVLERNLQKAAGANGNGLLGASLGVALGASQGPAVTYTNIESAPSLHAAKKHYCDITGLPARYTDPKTKLRYHDQEMFGVVRILGSAATDQYLAARGANRIKGAIDSRIAEEQARQAKQQQQVRPPQRRRLQPQDGASPRASSRQPDATGVPPIKGPSPDPSEFEPDFAVGTDESNVVSRVATPKPEAQPQNASSVQPQEQQVDSVTAGQDGATSEDKGKDKVDTPAPAPTPELPVEVKVRLRKLDKLETKYQELLRAYRTAHARLQTVEPFEATLRENTPLTSISDPTALVEYLNQNKLKSDMVLDELTRVTGERDAFKKKFEQSELSIDALKTELLDLKQKHDSSSPLPDAQPKPIAVPSDQAELESVSSPKSASSRIPSLSIFSPKTKPKEPLPKEASEDLFSFDSEVPRLEAELQERQTEVETLTGQVNSLRGDLKVARESTEGMVQTLENTTKELNELRDAKDKFEANEKQLQSRIADLEANQTSSADLDASRKELTELQASLAATAAKLDSAEKNIKDLEAKNQELESQIKQTGDATSVLNEKLAQKDHIVKDLEDSLAAAKLAEKERAKQVDQNKSSAKRLETMQGLLDAVRTKLDTAESTIKGLNLDLEGTRKDFEARPSTKLFGLLDSKPEFVDEIRSLTSRQELLEYVSANLDSSKTTNGESTVTTTSAPTAAEDATTSSSKKKNKKKKKGKGTVAPADDVDPGVPVKVSEDLSQEPDEVQRPGQTSQQFTDLQARIADLENELSQKREQIDNLNKRIKDQETLQEEIETLRDDLLHQGSEHVEARDALKSANENRKSLEETVAKLEADLAEVRSQQSSNTETANELTALRATHEQTSKDLADLQESHKALQNTLSTTETLSQSHQTNVTDLQTQLAALKEESSRLETAQQDLKNKASEIARLESKHEETKLQLKNLANRLSTQDADLKSVQSKVEQETAARIRLEGELSTSQSDLRATEARRIAAVEASELTNRELASSRTESDNLRTQIASLQDTISTQKQQIATLQSEIASKTALQKSTENVVQSLRSQTQELQTQYREVSGRAASVEEELSEAQRMLTERTREGQTMRMLLAQSESGTEARVREMRERMEKAVEERDRLEDESSVSSRRLTRDMDDAKAKLKDAQRQVKVLEAERDDLEGRTREWKRRKEELEEVSRNAEREVEEVRSAMRGLREALDESERALRDTETQRTEIKRACEEAEERVDKLERGNKNLTDELRNLQLQVGGRRAATARAGGDSAENSGRTSLDSRSARSPAPAVLGRMGSGVGARPETPSSGGGGAGGGAGLSQGTVDYVYLKNVLLQFLSQKDKAHQRQLIPVIGMLLHFDGKDEQRWNAAIAAR